MSGKVREGPRGIYCLCLYSVRSSYFREYFLSGPSHLHLQSVFSMRLTPPLAPGRGRRRHDLRAANNIPSPGSEDAFKGGPVTKVGPVRFSPGNFAEITKKTKLFFSCVF